MEFSKYTAAGNDFILIDGQKEMPEIGEREIRGLCHRRFGIGADGLMILTRATDYDFQMNYFNSDGSRGEMCGNGARSIVHFAASLGLARPTGVFLADDGPHAYHWKADHIEVQINVSGELRASDLPVQGCGQINTGVPHLVYPLDDIKGLDLDTLGHEMNDHPAHPDGTNLNIVSSHQTSGSYAVRTWERGVNQETLACGTGATAVAIFLHDQRDAAWPIVLDFPGGTLEVDLRGNQYWLAGPVELVYAGHVALSQVHQEN